MLDFFNDQIFGFGLFFFKWTWEPTQDQAGYMYSVLGILSVRKAIVFWKS